MVDLSSLAVPGVRRLQPYQGGKPIEEVAREFGLNDIVKLASNESPLGPSPQALAALQDAVPLISRYPDGNGFELRRALAAHLGLAAERITLGNGSNDVLDLVARAFAGPGLEIIFSAHAFAVYPIVTDAVGATPVVVPALNWGYDLDAVLAAVTPRTRVVFIANPNNPTGTWLPATDIEAFLKAVPEHVITVIDEAYFEYVGESDYGTAIAWTTKYPTLIVTRTFSKAYGLAGLRIGYGVAAPEVSDLLNRVRQPFNNNALALAAALGALRDTGHLTRSVEVNTDGMRQMIEGCNALGLPYIPSVGNFLCVEFAQPAADIFSALLRQGIIVRPVANYGMPRHLRISIGLEAENARCLAALRQLVS